MKNRDIKLSISVMAHESRAEYFPYLTEKLGDVPFAIDTDGPEHRGVWGNCKKAWSLADMEADYHVVIQDDAVVCEDFKKRAVEFIALFDTEIKDRAFNFYYGNRLAGLDMGRKGLEKGYTVKDTPTWGVAICLPTKRIKAMLEFGDKLKHIRQDDNRIGRYLKDAGIKVYFPLPSLIDHRTEIKSLVGDPGQGRKALFFIDSKK